MLFWKEDFRPLSGIIYEFDYLGMYFGNKLGRISHNLTWRITL